MARTARQPKDDDTGEIKQMDFDRAKSLYLNDIKPAKTQASSHGQTVAEAMKTIKKHCHIEPQGARKAFTAFEMEDAAREVHIRSFVGMFNALMGQTVLTCNFGDLVDQIQNEDGYARPKPQLGLVTLHDGGDDDLAEAAEFTEASEEELAQQEGRGASGD